MLEIELSVVIACYNEEHSIDEFYRRLSTTLSSISSSYEIIFVNDGSEDATFVKLEKIFDTDDHVSAIIDLYNNCGQEAALTAGFAYGRGRRFVVIDSDLQLAPEELPLLLAEAEKGCDIVGSYRTDRKDSPKRKIFSWLLNFVTSWVIQFPIRDIGCSFRVIDAALIRAFEPGPYRVFHLYYVFERAKKYGEVPVTHYPRKHGTSGWTNWKMLGLFVDNLIGFLHRPFLLLGISSLIGAMTFIAILLIFASGLINLTPYAWKIIFLASMGINLIVSTLVISVLGELGLRTHNVLMRKPAYVCRTIREKVF